MNIDDSLRRMCILANWLNLADSHQMRHAFQSMGILPSTVDRSTLRKAFPSLTSHQLDILCHEALHVCLSATATDALVVFNPILSHLDLQVANVLPATAGWSVLHVNPQSFPAGAPEYVFVQAGTRTQLVRVEARLEVPPRCARLQQRELNHLLAPMFWNFLYRKEVRIRSSPGRIVNAAISGVFVPEAADEDTAKVIRVSRGTATDCDTGTVTVEWTNFSWENVRVECRESNDAPEDNSHEKIEVSAALANEMLILGQMSASVKDTPICLTSQHGAFPWRLGLTGECFIPPALCSRSNSPSATFVVTSPAGLSIAISSPTSTAAAEHCAVIPKQVCDMLGLIGNTVTCLMDTPKALCNDGFVNVAECCDSNILVAAQAVVARITCLLVSDHGTSSWSDADLEAAIRGSYSGAAVGSLLTLWCGAPLIVTEIKLSNDKNAIVGAVYGFTAQTEIQVLRGSRRNDIPLPCCNSMWREHIIFLPVVPELQELHVDWKCASRLCFVVVGTLLPRRHALQSLWFQALDGDCCLALNELPCRYDRLANVSVHLSPVAEHVIVVMRTKNSMACTKLMLEWH